MSQYSCDLTPWTGDRPAFKEWRVAKPSQRRMALCLETTRQAKDGPAAGRRLTLTADNGGNNWITVVVESNEECRAMNNDPGFKQRTRRWGTNRPRYGSWGWYFGEVALCRYIFEFCGWTATPEEAQVMDALDEYGKRAPARYVTAA